MEFPPFQSRQAVVIHAPLQVVWEFNQDLTNIAAYHPRVERVDLLSGKRQRGKEVAYRCHLKDGKNTCVEKDLEVVPMERIVTALPEDTMGITNMFPDYLVETRLTPVASHETQVEFRHYYSTKSLKAKFFNVIAKRKIAQDSQDTLDAMKRTIEQETSVEIGHSASRDTQTTPGVDSGFAKASSSNSPGTRTDRRPTAVVIIALVQLIGTMIATIGGISLLLPGTFLDILWTLNPHAYRTFVGLRPVAATLLLGLGVLTFTAELGLFWRQRWSWWLTLFLLLVVSIVNVSRLVTGDPGEIFGTPLTLGLLWLHTRRNVRTFFRHNTVPSHNITYEKILNSFLRHS